MNNGAQKTYVGVPHFGLLEERDQNLRNNKQCPGMPEKFKTGRPASEDCTACSETVCEQQTVSHFLFKCSKFACLWRKSITKAQMWASKWGRRGNRQERYLMGASSRGNEHQ